MGVHVPAQIPHHVPLQTDIGPAFTDLGRGVWALRLGSRLRSGAIVLVSLDLAVTAMQTYSFQAALEGQTWAREKGGLPSLHSPLLASQSHQQFLSALFPVLLIFISDFSIVFAIFQQTDRPALPHVNRMQSSPTQILLANLH